MPAAAMKPTPTYDSERLNRLARRVAFRWEHNGIPFNFIDDLQQEASTYELEHGSEKWFLVDVRRKLNDVCAAWCWQSKRADTKGLKVLENGVGDTSWLEPSAPSPEGQALARIELERLWARSTPGQKKAIEALALSDQNERGQTKSSELAQFGIRSTKSLCEYLRAIRKDGHA